MNGFTSHLITDEMKRRWRRSTASHYRAFIEAAPSLTMATSNPGGLDVTPRGNCRLVTRAPLRHPQE